MMITFTQLQANHARDIKNVSTPEAYTTLLERHMYEVAIFPKINTFRVGDYVHMAGLWKGKICAFTSDGRLFIKEGEDDLGRNWGPQNVEKL